MEGNKNCLRVGAAVLVFALVLRLLGGSLSEQAVTLLTSPRTGAWLVFLATGRMTPIPRPSGATAARADCRPAAGRLIQCSAGPLVLNGTAADRISLRDHCEKKPDIQALLEQPLEWELVGDGPTVLILHSHGTESYTNTEGYRESGSYRTEDPAYNVISVGAYVARLLEEAGIRVIHDRTAHDQPAYNGAYEKARSAIQSALDRYPEICLVLDLHRDAAQDENGRQIGETVDTPEGPAARMMLVMGTDAGGLDHPNWQENLALGVKLQARLEELCPGICRPLQLRSSRFNQDLSAGAVLVEMGAAGNTRQEALRAGELLARAVIDLAWGTTGAGTGPEAGTGP